MRVCEIMRAGLGKKILIARTHQRKKAQTKNHRVKLVDLAEGS